MNPSLDIEDDPDQFCKDTSCKRRSPLQMLKLLNAALKHGKSANREELKQISLTVGGCPYYAARQLSDLSDVTLITH